MILKFIIKFPLKSSLIKPRFLIVICLFKRILSLFILYFLLFKKIKSKLNPSKDSFKDIFFSKYKSNPLRLNKL